MRLNRPATCVVLLGIAALILTGNASAQTASRSRYASSRKSAPSRIPALSGVDADSHYQRVMANSQIKVFRVTIAGNEATQLNAHPHDCLVVSLGDNDVEAVGDINTFPLHMSDGETQVLTGGWAHKIVNKSSQPANLVVVEVLHGIAPDQSVCGLSGRSCGQVHFGNTRDGRYSQTVLFETASVRLLRGELGPGGVLPRHDDAWGHLLVTLSQARLSDGLSDGLDQTAGSAIWTPGGLDTVKNTGTQDARLLIVELK